MEFVQIVRERYACKKFDEKKIPENAVEQLLELIRLSPSSYNLQPWKIKVISDSETKQKLVPVSGFNENQVSTCSTLLVFCAETGWKSLLERFEQLLRENKWPGEKIRSMMETRREFLSAKKPKELLHWAQLQVYLALGNCLNAAHALGFASCPLGAFDAKGYARVLALPSNLVPTIVVPIGFPADQPKPKARFSREQILV